VKNVNPGSSGTEAGVIQDRGEGARSSSVGAANVGSMGVEVNMSPVLCVLLVSSYFITDEKLSHLQVGYFSVYYAGKHIYFMTGIQ
jgi:hypothetical protein